MNPLRRLEHQIDTMPPGQWAAFSVLSAVLGAASGVFTYLTWGPTVAAAAAVVVAIAVVAVVVGRR